MTCSPRQENHAYLLDAADDDAAADDALLGHTASQLLLLEHVYSAQWAHTHLRQIFLLV